LCRGSKSICRGSNKIHKIHEIHRGSNKIHSGKRKQGEKQRMFRSIGWFLTDDDVGLKVATEEQTH
jgi:hypothetical protein